MSDIPKDRQIVIEHKNGRSVAIWSQADECFVYANLQVDLFQGKWNMRYFENESIDESDIVSWSEL